MESISSKPPTKLARCENFSERQIKKRKWKFVDICLRKFDIWTIIKSKSSCFILLLFNYDFMFIYHYHCTLFYFNLGICSRYLLWYIAPLQPEKIVHKVYQIWSSIIFILQPSSSSISPLHLKKVLLVVASAVRHQPPLIFSNKSSTNSVIYKNSRVTMKVRDVIVKKYAAKNSNQHYHVLIMYAVQLWLHRPQLHHLQWSQQR